AREMGLPVKRLIVATNENDILHRFIGGNEYSIAPLKHTWSPSMDILVSSNFERYLFDLFGRDSTALAKFMADGATGKASLSEARWRAMREVFDSASANDATTCATIAEVWREHGVLLDPHTAVGVRAARATCESVRDPKAPMICLATAHPAKFAEAVTAAGLPAPELPERLQRQFRRPERYRVVENDLAALTSILGGLAV
ncbi:MAG: threonine synthase, partial [Gammaproteobacteria bacterium]|nr:threonine synthase [Gammaproteobacteria bacterium]